MAWIESHTEIERHRKILLMAADLEMKPVHLSGHLHALWHAVLEQQEDGNLEKWPDQMIAHQAQFDGDAELFVSLLEKHELLEKNRLVHDWLDYAGRYLTNKYRTSNPKRLKGIFKLHKSNKSLTKVRAKSPHQKVISSPLGNLGFEEGECRGGDPPPPKRNGARIIPVRGSWPSVEALAKLWNEKTPDELMAVEKFETDDRIKAARKVLAANPEVEFWERVMAQIRASPFLRGLKPTKDHPNWKARFDWLLNENNAVRVYEGQYKD